MQMPRWAVAVGLFLSLGCGGPILDPDAQEDWAIKPVCGDGRCTGRESNATCPVDCSAPPPDAGVATAPVVSNVQVSAITQGGATISWSLNQFATGQVEYGLT